VKASVRWLRELCPKLPDDQAAIAARLTAAGLEVEASSAFGEAAKSCVVVAVRSTRPHPSRSGLQLVTVDRGASQIEVVCGAPNVPSPGGLVVLAPLGAHLAAKGLTVQRRSIAGIASEGMLCSEAELGLGDDASGLLVLPTESTSVGLLLSEALPEATDTVLEIGLTPNRPDGLGHVGLAREAAALFDVPFDPRWLPSLPPSIASPPVQIAIEDAHRCPHYGAAMIANLSVGRSPTAVRFRLASLGVRSISNVVDVTNLLMLEFGHPIHAFDLDKIRGRTIVVRRARAGESLRTLDSVERVLNDDDLVISDEVGPLALAGVMGGGESEIAATTARVLIECAYFEPAGIRRAARRHGLHTESSHRFERGVDSGDTPAVLARAVDRLKALSGGRLEWSAVIEARKLETRHVALRHARLEALLGTQVDRTEAKAVLDRLGFRLETTAPDHQVWYVPSFRPDVAREVDLIEEVGRVRGYDSIPAVLPRVRASRDANLGQRLARRVREAAVSIGLSEAITYSFVAPADLKAIGAPEPVVTLRNPLGEEQSVMRTSLLPGLLDAVSRAQRHGERTAWMFTVGALFLSSDGVLPREELSFCALVAGDQVPWLGQPRSVDVWDAKGLAERLVLLATRRALSLDSIPPNECPSRLHPRGAAWITVAGQRVGSLGPIHPDVMDAFELRAPSVAVELDLSALVDLGESPVTFVPLPRFPSSARDMAVVVKSTVPAGDVELVARAAAAEMAERVELFDRFEGGSIPAGHVSLALRVVYRSPDRTLTDEEVDQRHALVVASVQARFGAALRR